MMTECSTIKSTEKTMEAKDIAAATQGFGAVALSWLGIVDTLLSIALLSASLAFLIWRWRQAVKEKNG